MKREPGSLKALEAVQDNGPNYWIVTTGRWREPAAAICECEDDAVLFAAAPDMLKACRAALKYLQHPDVQAVTHGFALSGSAIEHRIEAAIRKAEA